MFAKKTQEQAVAPATNKRKILLVEANEALKISFMQFLGEYEVSTAGNGADGLNTLITFIPDLVIIDLELPVMDGKVMLHSLRAIPQFKATPVIAISEKGDADTLRQVLTYDNANIFLLKSNATPQELLNNIKTLIA